MIQVALQTTEENELQGGVADVVSRINSRFSTLTYQPVVFLHTQDLTFSQYLALLTVADAFLVASLREGMALRAHEFVECQEERKRPLILSEVCHYKFLSLKYTDDNLSSLVLTAILVSDHVSLSILGINAVLPKLSIQFVFMLFIGTPVDKYAGSYHE
jgi:hypothetical protein